MAGNEANFHGYKIRLPVSVLLFRIRFVGYWLIGDFCFLYKDDGIRGAIHLAGTAFDADRDINMRLCVVFRDRIILASSHTCTT